METKCSDLPVAKSFWLLSIQAGTLKAAGLEMTATMVSTSSLVNSPARLLESISDFFKMTCANRRPTPGILVIAYKIFVLPSMLVLRTRRMCWNSSVCILWGGAVMLFEFFEFSVPQWRERRGCNGSGVQLKASIGAKRGTTTRYEKNCKKKKEKVSFFCV